MEGVGRGICHMFSTTTLLLLLLLLITTSIEEMGPRVAEARTCVSASQLFKGVCLSASNCATICQSEGFEGGKCQGLRAKCICTKTCPGAPSPPSPPSTPSPPPPPSTPSPALQPTPTFD